MQKHKSRVEVGSLSTFQLPDSSRRNFLSWLSGATVLGLGGGLSPGLISLAQASSSSRNPQQGSDETQDSRLYSTLQAGTVAALVPALPIHKGGRTLLDKLTLESFAPHLNTTFHFRTGDESTQVANIVELELVEAKDKQPRSDERRVGKAFVLVFRGPAHLPLEQNTYAVEHERIGAFPLFIVPIGQDDKGRYYQAVFNRL